MELQVNYLAVIVATLASYAIASLWYGVIFRNLWVKLTGITEMKPSPMKIVLVLVGSFLMSYVLYHSIVFGNSYVKTSGIGGGLMGGFFNWIGFVAPVTLMGVMYEKRSWKLWGLDNAFWLISLLVMGAILSAWM